MLSASSAAQSVEDRGAGVWRILAWLGLLLAGALYVADPLELFFSFTPTFLADSNGSDSIVQIRANLQYVVATSNDEANELFGMKTELVADGALLDKWRSMQGAITKDLELLAQCQISNSCPAPAQKLIDLSLEGAGRTGRARLGLINRAVDLAIRPVSDEAQWGVSDHWSDPFETLTSNRGDCEDYAIVKYAALLQAGVPKSDVKIVVLKNLFPIEHHAVAAARVDGEWLILDNRTLTLVRDTDVARTIPEFVLDTDGVRRFVWAGRNRRATS